jgi:hypothetical protein
MKTDDRNHDNVPATLSVALGFWTAAVAAGTHAGVLARLPAEVLAALVLFAIAFAVATVTVDAPLRAWLDERRTAVGRLALSGLAVIAAGAVASFAATAPVGAPESTAYVPVFLLVLPATAALAVAAIGAAGRACAGAFRPPASKGPAPRRVAT